MTQLYVMPATDGHENAGTRRALAIEIPQNGIVVLLRRSRTDVTQFPHFIHLSKSGYLPLGSSVQLGGAGMDRRAGILVFPGRA